MTEPDGLLLENLNSGQKELQHICKNEDDDEDDLFHSLEFDNAEDFGLGNMSGPSEKVPPKETSLKKDKSSGDKEGSGSKPALLPTDYESENQCIDENSANDSTIVDDRRSGVSRHGDRNSGGLFADTLNEQTPNKQIHQSFNFSSDDFEQGESCFVDLGTASTTTIYRRNGGNASLVSLDARGSRTTNESSLERSNSCTDECPHHSDEIIKYLCMSCYKLACQVCFTIEHQNCNSREFIPSLVGKPDFGFEDKCKKFEAELYQLQKGLKLSQGKVEMNIKACKRMSADAKSEFKKQREEINKIFDCLEQDFDRKLWEIENNDKEKMQTIMSRQAKIGKKLEEQIEDYFQRKQEGNTSRVFTKMEMSRKVTDEMKNKLADIEVENTINRYIYTPSKAVVDFTKNISELGRIENIDSKTKRTVTDINAIQMKTKRDKKACKISGLVLLSESHLLAVDYGNSSLKIVDSEYDVTSIPVAPAPFDVALVRDQERTHDQDTVSGQIVLTLPKENKLRFMEYMLPGSFAGIRDVETNGQCRSIIYCDSKLYVTFPSKGKIEIVDMEGELLKRITTKTTGRMFQPQFIAVNKEGCKIFISDNENHAVFSMTMEGEVTAIYTDHDLIQPRGLCVNQTGAIFVCSFATHRIHHVSDECNLISTMDVADDNNVTPYPFSIAYCDKTQTLYVGLFTKDCIKAYKLT